MTAKLIHEGWLNYGNNKQCTCGVRIFETQTKRVVVFTQQPNDHTSIMQWIEDLYEEAKTKSKVTHVVAYLPAHGHITHEAKRIAKEKGEELKPPYPQKLHLVLERNDRIEWDEISMEDLHQLLDGFQFPEFHEETKGIYIGWL